MKRRQQYLDTPGTLYLLHFTPAFHHAQHYLGWTECDVDQRIRKHLRGDGAKIVRAALAAGCVVTCVRMWPGTKRRERGLKSQRALQEIVPSVLSATGNWDSNR